MADEVDIANDSAQEALERGIEAAKRGATGPFANLNPTGRCHWCSEPVPQGRLHCCPAVDSCAEDHHQYLRFRGGDHRE